ncbi:PREDICTED: ATP-binding cassette sub-family A member 5-like isoform X2 [Acropora digitifera]|uniref:ATP-binding cassette sub-family A member 5-like isoform X2 n=1 Tax=Acropora digitifera TaxID=70779 RepID=UPI00077B1420|nr:PREDICTED: ATP-binding cassette sub-family A member 5-like isoform X2 [Acropora digitifera]
MGVLNQTRYLLQKNFIIKKRNKRETLQELLIPLWWTILLLVLKKALYKTGELPAVSDRQIPTVDIFKLVPRGNTSKSLVGYVTNGLSKASLTIELLKNSSQSEERYVEFNTTDSMLDYYRKYSESRGFKMGIEFTKGKNQGLAYTLRLSKKNFPKADNKLVGQQQCRDMSKLFILSDCQAYSYIVRKEAALQARIDAAITTIEANLSHYVVPNIEAQMMPKDSYTSSMQAFSLTSSIYLVLAFVPYITALLVSLVQEKEQKQKELMRIMGMSDLAYWLSWLFTYAIILFFSVLVLNAILVFGGSMGNSNYFVMVIIFFLYSISIIVVGFLMTPFFKVAKTAGTVASMLTTLLGLIAIPLILVDVARPVRWALSLFSPTAFAVLVSQASDSEGLHFQNLTTKGDFPPINYVIMLIVDIILYFLLALYFDAVIPAEYGQRRHPLFIFRLSFWKSCLFCAGKNGKAQTRKMSTLEWDRSEDIEAVHGDMERNKAISIHCLRKVFHGKEQDTVAVDGVSMYIYEGQITALLGHNGAGKTTLIALITGMVPVTDGYATVYGMDITDPNQMKEIRKLIGVCPQQNVIFDFMTVQEHLEFYYGLKGIAPNARDAKVTQLLKDIDLIHVKDTLSRNLSGGQKRKLCVGSALIGDPKVVVLDEPTSGMDPYSRRLMWTLLQEQSKNKAVVLTTHFMDEADILADYKAILSKGKVRCAGSSLFLKSRFGIGYHLNMALADNCDAEKLTEIVQSKVQGANVIRHHGRELAFTLPMEQVSNFPDLLQALEANSGGSEGCSAPLLGVTSYGVSMTTLEEVFLQLEDTNQETEGETDEFQSFEDGATTAPVSEGGQELNQQNLSRNSQKPLWKTKQQMLALLKIRWLTTLRSPLKIFFMILLPPIFLVVGLVLSTPSKRKDDANTPQSLVLNPELYLKPGGQESYATLALLQNATNHAIGYIMAYFAHYKVATELVASIADVLNSSLSKTYNLDFKIRQFPAAVNLSQSSPAGLTSSFLLRFNDTTVHSVPVGVNILGSVLHMNALKSLNQTLFPLETTLLSFPSLKPEWTFDSSSFFSVLMIGIAFVVIPGSFAIEVVALRQEKLRHILRVSGVSSSVYWLQFFIADAIIFLIPSTLLLILIPAFKVPSLTPAPAMVCLVVALLLFLPSAILFSYVFSFLFKKWEFAQSVMPQLYLYGSLVPWLVVSLVDMTSSENTAIIIHYVFTFLIPPYPVYGALYYIDRAYRVKSIEVAFQGGASKDVHMTAGDYFDWTKHNGIVASLIAPVFHTIVFSLLLYVLDQRDIGALSMKCSCTQSVECDCDSTEQQDEDVKQEKERIANVEASPTDLSSFSVVVKDLWKKFGSGIKSKTAVKGLSFGVERGEIFGLLGPNGAGKTSSLNMITTDFPPTKGKVYVAGYEISKHPMKAFEHMGYCPQADTLWNVVTVKEHLQLFARVRGIPWGDVNRVVDHYLSALRITEHADKRSKHISGGTKRKVCFANAMLGDPDLLLLDEPSSGMDPSARRFFWNTISKNVKGNCGAILTTHSMEEADALCSRVGIMVKGQLKCLGSTQHLKSTHGSGYTLEIKLAQTQASGLSSDDAMEQLHNYISQMLPGATRSEVFGGRVTYKVHREGVGALSVIFHQLEKGKETVGIEEYSFSQSTLEQVFLEFAREQDDERTGAGDAFETK